MSKQKRPKRRWYRRLRNTIIAVAVSILLLPAAVLGVFRFINPPTTAYMLRIAAHTERPIYQRWVPLGRIADCMPRAVVASEDQTFPTNWGFDFGAIKNALIHNLTTDDRRGASTITQQAAKNLFLWPAQTYFRKAIEAYISLWMVALWPKRRIMTVYLNVAQFGERIFGVGAAARRLFGVPALNLSRLQCARLAAILPDPTGTSVVNPGDYVQWRTQWVLEQMDNLGRTYLDEALASD